MAVAFDCGRANSKLLRRNSDGMRTRKLNPSLKLYHHFLIRNGFSIVWHYCSATESKGECCSRSNSNTNESISQTAAYITLLHSTLVTATTSITADLTLFIETIISDQIGQVVARQVLSEFVKKISAVEDVTENSEGIANREIRKDLMNVILLKLQPKIVTFEEQVQSL